MAVVRFSLTLDDRVFTALAQLADRERRPVREQAAHMLTAALELCGLVEKAEHPGGPAEVLVTSLTDDVLDSIIASAPAPSTPGDGDAGV